MNNIISYLRTIAIVAIVLHHSMAAFCGWPPNHAIGGDIPPFTYYIGGMSKGFGLAIFTFISGFVLYYKVDKDESYKQFLYKKVKRILLPCLFWACVYGFFFNSYMYSIWPSTVNGTHLWYLPMLFLCLMVTASHFHTKHSLLVIGSCYVVLALLGKFTHFRTFIEFCFYYPIFYVGFLSNKYGIGKKVISHKYISLFVGIGGAGLWLSRIIVLYKLTDMLNMLVISVSAYILFCLLFSRGKIGFVGGSLSKESFSIYLMHQFVINILIGTFNMSALNYWMSLIILFLCALFIPWGTSYCYGYFRKNMCEA